MRRFKGRRPSPAMIVAGAALIIALAGTAMAAPTAIKSVLDKKEKKQVKNIAKNQITKRAPGLSVASAKAADNANALGGLAASAYQERIRWALVENEGAAAITAQSGGITLVDHPSAGRFLLDFGSSVVGHGVVTAPNFGSYGLDADEVAIGICLGDAPPGGSTSCPAVNGNQLLVDVENSAGTNVDADFWVAVIK